MRSHADCAAAVLASNGNDPLLPGVSAAAGCWNVIDGCRNFSSPLRYALHLCCLRRGWLLVCSFAACSNLNHH